MKLLIATLCLVLSPLACAADNDWSGFYLGGHGQFHNTSSQWNDLVVPSDTGMNVDGNWVDATSGGYSAGFQGGYNFLVSEKVLLGIEAKFSMGDLSNGQFCEGDYEDQNASCNTDFGTIYQVSGRLGFMPAEKWLFYTKVGSAWSNAKFHPLMMNNYSDYTYLVTHKNINGWLAGIGAETWMTDKLRLGFEFTHMDFGTETINFTNGIDPLDEYTTDFNSKISTKLNFFAITLNYAF